MKSTLVSAIASLVTALVFVGCTDRDTASSPSAAAGSGGTGPSPVTAQWLGKWNGPEGTFLQVLGSTGRYEITIQNLDGPRTFQGKAMGDRIEFERDGIKEAIRATNGSETGMKWLSEKTNCLTVRAGEGYCR